MQPKVIVSDKKISICAVFLGDLFIYYLWFTQVPEKVLQSVLEVPLRLQNMLIVVR